MNDSLKLAALFLWVMSAIYIKEDAKQKIKHHPVISYDYNASPGAHINGADSVTVVPREAQN